MQSLMILLLCCCVGQTPKNPQEALAKAKISLVEALNAALKAAPDERILIAIAEMREDRPTYRVVTQSNDAMHQISIDAVSGKLLENQTMKSKLTGQINLPTSIPSSVKLDFFQAIKAAETEIPGSKAVGGQLFNDGSGPFTYLMAIAEGQKSFSVMLDPLDGEILYVMPTSSYDERYMPPQGPFDPHEPPKGWKSMDAGVVMPCGSWITQSQDVDGKKCEVLRVEKNICGPFGQTMMAMEGKNFDDVRISARVRPEDGKRYQDAGVFWRAKNLGQFYGCYVDVITQKVVVCFVNGYAHKPIALADFPCKKGTWYGLRVEMIGKHVTVSIDGKKILQADDATYTEPGSAGVWARGDATASFADISVIASKEK